MECFGKNRRNAQDLLEKSQNRQVNGKTQCGQTGSLEIIKM